MIAEAKSNYLDAAGAAAEADDDALADASFFAFFDFFALAGFADASADAAAGVEAAGADAEAAGASAANAETANTPAIRAAIRFFILCSLSENLRK